MRIEISRPPRKNYAEVCQYALKMVKTQRLVIVWNHHNYMIVHAEKVIAMAMKGYICKCVVYPRGGPNASRP